MATKTLYIGNLSYGTTESALVTAFSPYGSSNCRIIEGRGFGFIDIDGDKLETAISEMNEKQMDGRSLTVSEARPKEKSSGYGSRR